MKEEWILKEIKYDDRKDPPIMPGRLVRVVKEDDYVIPGGGRRMRLWEVGYVPMDGLKPTREVRWKYWLAYNRDEVVIRAHEASLKVVQIKQSDMTAEAQWKIKEIFEEAE